MKDSKSDKSTGQWHPKAKMKLLDVVLKIINSKILIAVNEIRHLDKEYLFSKYM